MIQFSHATKSVACALVALTFSGSVAFAEKSDEAKALKTCKEQIGWANMKGAQKKSATTQSLLQECVAKATKK